ncbi:hypothetical protein SLEP1_g11917 [Rubroshorea leprosula]|nr:hypothetical protein SLEP1_g11917 [Rubroshorea leprosula]
MRELARDSARVRARFLTAKDSGSGIRRQLPRWQMCIFQQCAIEEAVGLVLFHKQLEKQWIRRDSKVTPGKTYAQVVVGNMGALKEGKSSTNGIKQVVAKKGKEAMEDAGEEGLRLRELNVVPETSPEKVTVPEIERVLNFIPKDDEVVWLKQSMVAKVRSLDMVKKIQNSLDVEGLMVNVALLGGRQVILVDNSEGGLEEFLNQTRELVELWFEWIKPCSLSTVSSLSRLDWWLVGERRNPTTQPSLEYFSSEDEEGDDGYSDLNLNLNGNGFLGEDGRELAEDHVVTDLDLNIELSRQVESKGEEAAGFVGLNGLEEFGPDKGNQVGPGVVDNVIGLEEAQPSCGSIFKIQETSTQLQQMALTEKKHRNLREIYAGVARADESMRKGDSWITARTKSRRDRRITAMQEEERPNLQQESCSVSDGCIQHRNEIIRRQLETNEVRELFVLGQRLGIQCQQNDEDVISRLAALEERDERKASLWEEIGGSVLEEGEGTGLIDIKLRNRKFTWYRPDGTSMSKLDRFLLTIEMSLLDREWTQVGVRRSISDHCAIILTSRNVDWGPKPFQVLDAWQQYPDFREFVEDRWKAMQIKGWASYKCKQKLKLLKEECKGWNSGVFGNVETQFDTLLKQVERLDKKSEEDELEENEVLLRKECFQGMWDILRKREAVWKQKARTKWVRLGDANTAFFHRSVHARRAQNGISGILGENGWVEEPDVVKEEAIKYFSKLFRDEKWHHPVLGGIQFHRISAIQKKWLERPFTIEEIEEGLQSCAGSKAPGPNGFNFNFIKFAWSTMKDDFVNFL